MDRLITSSVVIAAVVSFLAACGSPSGTAVSDSPSAGVSSASPMADGENGTCSVATAPLEAATAQDPAEPRLLVPRPPGWARNTSMDSNVIRYVMANETLTSESFTPTVVVTLERYPDDDVRLQDVLAQQQDILLTQAGATNLTVTPASTCGLTSETIAYTAAPQGAVPARPATVLLVAAVYGTNTWLATVTIQAVDAQNPTYQQDSAVILSGFQMLPPSP